MERADRISAFVMSTAETTLVFQIHITRKKHTDIRQRERKMNNKIKQNPQTGSDKKK